jgi:hypothetical protein
VTPQQEQQFSQMQADLSEVKVGIANVSSAMKTLDKLFNERLPHAPSCEVHRLRMETMEGDIRQIKDRQESTIRWFFGTVGGMILSALAWVLSKHGGPSA